MASKKYGYMATIGADTSGLASALQTMDAEAKKVSAEIREINNNLKFEDGGTVALQQKYELLQQVIEQTRQKLDTLRNAEEKVNAAAESGKISEANQRLFQRELDSTANKLVRYQKEAEETSKTLKELESGQQTANDAMQTSEEIADIVHKAMQRYSDSAKSAAAANAEESDSLDKVGESAQKAAEELKKVALSNNVGYDESAIEYIKNFGKKTEEAVSVYDKYKRSVGETNEAIKQSETEYNKLNKLLADNADNQVLAAQKNEIKNQLIEAETYKLNKLNRQYTAMKHAFDKGDIGAEQFREFQREIEQTKIKLNELVKSEENAEDAAKDYEKAIKGAGRQTVTFGNLVKANFLGDVISSAFHKAVDAVGDFIKRGITLASSLTEVQNVVDTTFGDGAEQIYEWADTAAESFGMSSLAAQKYNGTIGAMLKSQGVANDSILEMSQNLVGLAGDMASFYNLDVDLAFEKIRAGISGETEPLKQLGINMSVANLEAYAFAQGIETAYDKMSQSEQAILRYNYLMSVTADAQGNFAKTSDSFANQQRILQLQWENLSASLGAKLLPSLNDVLNTANEKLPRAERSIENIGKILGAVTEFALENHEAILGLITAYGTFYGVMKAGNAVNTAVSAIKSLTSATKSAEAAQKAHNAAAAANPYVLLASAIAAVTVGLIAYEKSIDSVDNRIKDVNNDVKDLKKNTEESISDTEAEIAVFQAKAREYEELRENAKRTAGEEERLAQLAQELQEYMPGGTRLINEQTGAYSSLADSIDSVSESMRLKATIAAYEDEYTELIKRQLEAQKNLEEAQNMNFAQKNRYGLWNVLFGDTEENARESLDNINNDVEELEKALTGLREEQAANKQTLSVSADFHDYDSALSTTGRYYETQGKLSLEAAEKEKAAREQDLKDYVAALDEKQDLRRISEEEYYNDLYDYLMKYEDRESVEWYKQLGRYEDYQQKLADAAEKAAEDEQKAEKDRQDAAKKAADEAETERINAIKKSWDNISRLKERGEIDDEKEYKLKAQLVKDYCNENEDTWDDYYKWLYDYTKNKEDEIEELRLKNLEDSAKEQADKLEKAYADIKSKKEQVKKDLQSIDLTDTVKGKDGKDILILNDLDAEIKKIDKYEASMAKLKAAGISDSLADEIEKLNYANGDRQQYIDTLLSLPDDKLRKYLNDWDRLRARQEEAANSAVAAELEETNKEAEKAISGTNEMLDRVSKSAYEKGAETAKNFLRGLKDSMNGLNDTETINAVFRAGYADKSGMSVRAKETLTTAQNVISADTPIKIFIDRQEAIETTIWKILDAGSRSGGNVLHL